MEEQTKKASLVYLVMLGIAIVGLWSILSAGNRFLKSQEDLAGKWKAVDESAPEPFRSMTVMQSGRFFRIFFEDGPRMDMVLQDDPTPVAAGRVKLKLAGDGWTAHITGNKGGDDFDFVFFKDADDGKLQPMTIPFHRTEHGYGSPEVAPQPTTAPAQGSNARI